MFPYRHIYTKWGRCLVIHTRTRFHHSRSTSSKIAGRTPRFSQSPPRQRRRSYLTAAAPHPSSRVHLHTETLTVTRRTTSLSSGIFDSSTAKPPHCRTPRDARRVCLADYGDLPSRMTINPPASPTCHLRHCAPPRSRIRYICGWITLTFLVDNPSASCSLI
ncbi:hypothetical protein R3P38DRAFT_3201906 [Favolaschia claudopus]|uniref:Uncharacterized protein n=1 Tax=Favolaschia claudopus TaxID=2862362 RepID=A0AAW0AXE9_9AGAR